MQDFQRILAAVVEQGPTAVLITDLSGTIEYVNPIFTEITGYTFDEVRGKNPRILKSGLTPLEIYQGLWKTILSGQVWQGELWNRTKKGDIYAESILIAPLRNSSGKVTHFVGMWQDVTRRKVEEEYRVQRSKVLEKESITDDLTGQYNRRHLLEELEIEVERSKRYGRHLSGMMIDIDDLKIINDRYGHLMGDRVIKTFSTVIRKSIRKIDILGRYGGDEFIVILPEAAVEIAKLVAERIQKNLAEYRNMVGGELSLPLTASIGSMSFEDIPAASQTAFIEKIDQALLQAKKLGKNRIFWNSYKTNR